MSHNNSQSPASQTFFKDNSKKNNNMAGKKGFPKYSKKAVNNNMYVSSYAQKQNMPKMIPQNQNQAMSHMDNQYATADEAPNGKSFNSN